MERSTASILRAREPESSYASRSTLAYAKLLYIPEEAAKLLSISRSRLYILLARSVISSIKEGRARLIPLSALDQYVHRRLAEQAPLTTVAELEQIRHLRRRQG